MSEQTEKLPPIHTTFSGNSWYAWAEDVPMTQLAAKNRTQAAKEACAIAKKTGRNWGGRRHTPKQAKSKDKKRQKRKAIKLAEMESANKRWAELQHYTWANRENWTNEDWENYQAGLTPLDELDDADYLDAVMGI